MKHFCKFFFYFYEHCPGKITRFEFTKMLQKACKGAYEQQKEKKGSYTSGQNTVKNCNWEASKQDWGGGFCPLVCKLKEAVAEIT